MIDDFDVLIGSTHNANRILSNTTVDKLGHEEERRLGWLVPVTSYGLAALWYRILRKVAAGRIFFGHYFMLIC